MSDISERIQRAKELLASVRHAAMATVNDDGTPHNTPFLFLHNENVTKIYWGSHPESQHSKNVLKNGRLFVVLYEANEKGGLYVQANNGRIVEGNELEEALHFHNTLRKKEGKAQLEKQYYETDSSQKMWAADVEKLWVNAVERDAHGRVTRDYRVPVKSSDLLS